MLLVARYCVAELLIKRCPPCLQWVNECFCGNSYGNQGEADIADCDADGVLDDDGTASLCANGQGNCGWRNAVYSIGGR